MSILQISYIFRKIASLHCFKNNNVIIISYKSFISVVVGSMFTRFFVLMSLTNLNTYAMTSTNLLKDENLESTDHCLAALATWITFTFSAISFISNVKDKFWFSQSNSACRQVPTKMISLCFLNIRSLLESKITGAFVLIRDYFIHRSHKPQLLDCFQSQ